MDRTLAVSRHHQARTGGSNSLFDLMVHPVVALPYE